MLIPVWVDILAVFAIAGILFILLFILSFVSRIFNAILLRKIRKDMERRANSADSFRSLNGYSWDYVIVFKIFEDDEIATVEQQKHNLQSVLDHLSAGGLEILLYYSLLRKSVICKIRAPMSRLLLEGKRHCYSDLI